MSIVLRPGTPTDAAVCGPICFEAFKAIDDAHNFPWDFPSAEIATGLLTMMLSNPGFYSVVAEKEGKVIGSNLLDERGPIAGVGPITVGGDWCGSGLRGWRISAADPQRGRVPLVPGKRPAPRAPDELMTIGLYNEPDGAYLPSVLY